MARLFQYHKLTFIRYKVFHFSTGFYRLDYDGALCLPRHPSFICSKTL
nr:MAG TPA: hypothetical protein [Caudoviricetes sp.]